MLSTSYQCCALARRFAASGGPFSLQGLKGLLGPGEFLRYSATSSSRHPASRQFSSVQGGSAIAWPCGYHLLLRRLSLLETSRPVFSGAGLKLGGGWSLKFGTLHAVPPSTLDTSRRWLVVGGIVS